METQFKKTIIRSPFDVALGKLQRELAQQGFEITGTTNFQQVSVAPVSIASHKHTVLTIHQPFLYQQMMFHSPFDGVILPCMVSVIEVHAEETAIVPCNVTAIILTGIQSVELVRLALEVTDRLEKSIHEIEKDQRDTHDLVTSWN